MAFSVIKGALGITGGDAKLKTLSTLHVNVYHEKTRNDHFYLHGLARSYDMDQAHQNEPSGNHANTTQDVLPADGTAALASEALTILPEFTAPEAEALRSELAFADMIAETERLGLYDTDPDDVKAALKAARKQSER